MKASFALVAAVMVVGTLAYAQQPQQQKFTTCSQVAEFARQNCAGNQRCAQTIENRRTECLTTGTYSGPSVGTYSNLRKE